MRAAAFLDRDGVLNELVADPVTRAPESPLRPEDVRLIPGAAAAAARLARAGYALVCVSNQPAAAKGKVSVEQLLAVHERVRELLSLEGVVFEASRLCFHHPDGIVAALSVRCECRKPAPGMLRNAATAHGLELNCSWMVGDTDTDVQAGQAASCRTLLICNQSSVHKRLQGITPDLLADSLADGVTQLLSQKLEGRV